MIQEEENEGVRHRFRQFKNAEVTKRFGVPLRKPDFKLVPPQNTQIFDSKRPA